MSFIPTATTSSFNAIKHGILSEEAVLTRGELQEDRSEFEVLRDALFDEIQPVGIIEVMLTDKLFTQYWRLRRVIKAERATIERHTIGHSVESAYKRERHQRLKDSFPIDCEPQTLSSAQWRQHADGMKLVVQCLDESFPLPSEVLAYIRCLDAVEMFSKQAEGIYALHFTIAERLESDASADVTSSVDNLRESVRRLQVELDTIALREEQSQHDLDAALLDEKAIPDTETLNKLQRYETTLHRTFTQTLHELQRVQSRRLGMDVPVPASLDITVSKDS